MAETITPRGSRPTHTGTSRQTGRPVDVSVMNFPDSRPGGQWDRVGAVENFIAQMWSGQDPRMVDPYREAMDQAGGNTETFNQLLPQARSYKEIQVDKLQRFIAEFDNRYGEHKKGLAKQELDRKDELASAVKEKRRQEGLLADEMKAAKTEFDKSRDRRLMRFARDTNLEFEEIVEDGKVVGTSIVGKNQTSGEKKVTEQKALEYGVELGKWTRNGP